MAKQVIVDLELTEDEERLIVSLEKKREDGEAQEDLKEGAEKATRKEDEEATKGEDQSSVSSDFDDVST